MNPRGGYIALMSAIVVSVVLIALLSTLSMSGFFGRYDVLGSEFKSRSFGLAEACANAAILSIGNDPTYTGSTTLSIGGDSCYIFPMAAGSGLVRVQGTYQHSYTNLKLRVDTTTLATLSFQEVPTLP